MRKENPCPPDLANKQAIIISTGLDVFNLRASKRSLNKTKLYNVNKKYSYIRLNCLTVNKIGVKLLYLVWALDCWTWLL